MLARKPSLTRSDSSFCTMIAITAARWTAKSYPTPSGKELAQSYSTRLSNALRPGVIASSRFTRHLLSSYCSITCCCERWIAAAAATVTSGYGMALTRHASIRCLNVDSKKEQMKCLQDAGFDRNKRTFSISEWVRKL